MDELLKAITDLIPPHFQPLALAVAVLIPRGLYAYTRGGSVRDALSAMFLGTNTPPPVVPPDTKLKPPTQLGTVLLLCALGLSLSACSTATEYKAAATTQVSVDVAMSEYGNYLKTHKVPDQIRAKVRDAYIRYQNCMAEVADAEEVSATLSTNAPSGVIADTQARQTAALAAASQALLDLTTLLQSFGALK